MRIRLLVVLFAALLTAGPGQAQLPPAPVPVGLPPDPKPVGLPPDPTPAGSPPAASTLPIPTPAPSSQARPRPPGAAPSLRQATAPPPAPEIVLPEMLAVELPHGAATIGPDDPPLRQLLAAAHSDARKVTWDLRRRIGVGPVRVTFSAWDGAPGSGQPAATRAARLFVLPNGMTPVGVSGDENSTGGNNAVHIARDSGGAVHMIWSDSGRPGARIGAVYRRASTGPDGSVHFETPPIYVADGPGDWNAYPALAVQGRDVQLVWQGGGTAHTRRVSLGPGGWAMGPIVDTGARSEGHDVGDCIAFDDKGGLHLVTPSAIYAFSGDGGKTWKTEDIPLPPNAKLKTQSVTVDAAGTVHVAFSAQIARPDPPGAKLGGYWPLRTIDRTAKGWANATDVLANAPGWRESHGPEDVLADWARIAADRQGGLHITWHGTTLSHVFAHDTAFYAWKRPGAPWSAPVAMVPPDAARGIKYSYAPSLALDGDRALAMVFYEVYEGANAIGFDSALVPLKDGRMEASPLPSTQFVRAAIVARHSDTAMGMRFPSVAPTVFHAPGGRPWLDVLELMQSPFEPAGPNLVIYQRLDLTATLRRP